MPVIFLSGRYRFLFYANEGSPHEPPHIHVDQDDNEAKFWLQPEVWLAYNDGSNAKRLREVLDFVVVNRERAQKGRNDFFG